MIKLGLMQPIRTVLALAGCLAFSGCTVTSPHTDRAIPKRFASGSLQLPSPCQRMVRLARQEWGLFGALDVRDRSNGKTPDGLRAADALRHELEPAMLTRVLAYGAAGRGRSPLVDVQGALRPWSGAFINWLARSAGFEPTEFPDTLLHWDYIAYFMNTRPERPFTTRNPAEYAPGVGDLVCTSRQAGPREVNPQAPGMLDWSALRPGAYHCDLVVNKQAGELQMIGGNVSNTVAMTRVATDRNGRLLPDRRRIWAAIVAHTPRDPSQSCQSGYAASTTEALEPSRYLASQAPL